jgi:hypothetical protein
MYTVVNFIYKNKVEQVSVKTKPSITYDEVLQLALHKFTKSRNINISDKLFDDLRWYI